MYVRVCVYLTCPVSYLPCCFRASNTPTVSKIFPSGLFLPNTGNTITHWTLCVCTCVYVKPTSAIKRKASDDNIPVYIQYKRGGLRSKSSYIGQTQTASKSLRSLNRKSHSCEENFPAYRDDLHHPCRREKPCCLSPCLHS